MIEEKFALTVVKSKSFTFTEKIENFSLQLRMGDFISQKHLSELTNCKWSLVVCENKGEIDIILQRVDYVVSWQDLDIKIWIVDNFIFFPFYRWIVHNFGFFLFYPWIVDNFGFFLFHPIEKRQRVKFSPDDNTEKFLSVSMNKLLRDNLMLNKLRFLPNDTLTVKCEITTYNSNRITFENKDKYEERSSVNMKTEFYEWMKSALFFFLIFFLLMGGFFLIYYFCVKPLFMQVALLMEYIIHIFESFLETVVQIIKVLCGFAFIFAVYSVSRKTERPFPNKCKFEEDSKALLWILSKFSSVSKFFLKVSFFLFGIVFIYYFCVKPTFMKNVLLIQNIFQIDDQSVEDFVQITDSLLNHVFFSAVIVVCVNNFILHFIITVVKKPKLKSSNAEIKPHV